MGRSVADEPGDGRFRMQGGIDISDHSPGRDLNEVSFARIRFVFVDLASKTFAFGHQKRDCVFAFDQTLDPVGAVYVGVFAFFEFLVDVFGADEDIAEQFSI